MVGRGAAWRRLVISWIVVEFHGMNDLFGFHQVFSLYYYIHIFTLY